MTKIVVFVGSLRKESFNKTLAKNLEQLAPDGVVFDYAAVGDLPLLNQDLEANFPAEAQAIKDQVEAADGVLIVTPEYNRSVPGVLKNAIDWTSRPWGHNSFVGKPTGIVGASTGPIGTAVAQADLRHIMAYLGTKLMAQPELYVGAAHDFFGQGGIVIERHRELLQTYVNTFIKWVESEK